MKLLITGGCGFLGSNLAAHALARGDDLGVFDNLSRQGSTQNLVWLKNKGRFSFIHGDIRNQNDLRKVITSFKPDCVYHLAGQVAMTTSIDNPRLDFEVNTLGTINLLELIRDYSPATALIYSSTNKVYGDLEQFTYRETKTRFECIEKPDGFDETTALDFRSPYGCSKGAADQYILDYARVYGLKTVVFRHSSMYGGRQFATYDQGWIGWFCKQAIDIKNNVLRNPFTISGNGKQVRDILYSEDMCRLYLAAVENVDKVKGHVFNIGGGMRNSFSLLELFDFLNKELDVKMSYTMLPPRKSDQKIFVADLRKVHQLLGWFPMVTKEDGIRLMLDWERHIVSNA